MNVPQPSPGRDENADAAGPAWWRRLLDLPRPVHIGLAGIMFMGFWYGILGTFQAIIAPDPALRPTAAQLPPGGSVAVGFAARLIDVEVNDRNFTPNNPLFFPTGFTRRTPAYQQRVIATTRGVVAALATGAADDPISRAAQHLETPAEQWWLNAGWPPIRPSAERAYRSAIVALQAYNNARSTAARPDPDAIPRIDSSAMAAIASLVIALEAEAAQGDQLIQGGSENNAAVQLAAARGTAHAAAMLLRGLRDDNIAAIRSSGRAARWATAIDSLDLAASHAPIVTRQSDLVRTGYHLLIANAALREILE